MRPIKLKIKGLNSFIEEQIIDFDRLTDRGLFGIFGPTGSGKSTVLDGITLALYGDVSRKSSNYINTNCDKLNVSFEFQISGSEVRRYLVNREFKRDKKSGNPVSSKCKIVDITAGEEVLADKVKSVTDKCKEIIGLSLDDFTRTVVLPQGKFSEFLKLEGKQRREMLERLFNLQEYGDNLSRKLSREINREKTENSVLLGQLMGYENITEEKRHEKAEELKLSIENLDKANKEFQVVENCFRESQELWKLQIEVEEYRKTEEKLIEKTNEIELLKEKVRLGEAAFRLNPHIILYNENLKMIDNAERELKILEEKIKELEKNKNKIEEEWNIASRRKENELPEYKIKEDRVKEALEEKKYLDTLNNEINSLNKTIKEFLNKKKDNEEKLVDSENRLKKGNRLIIEEEKHKESLKVDSDFKFKVQKGVVITNDYNKLYKRVSENREKIESIKTNINKLLVDKDTVKDTLDKKNRDLIENKRSLEELIKNCPGNQDDLLELQNIYSESKRKLLDYKAAKAEILKYEGNIIKLSDTLKLSKENNIELLKEIEKLKASVKEIEIENLAHSLRETLNSGEICPVCGSVEHHKENIKHIELKDISMLEQEIKDKENLSKKLESNIIEIETKVNLDNERIKEKKDLIDTLGNEFSEDKVIDLEKKLNTLKKNLNEYSEQKEKLEKIINSLNEESYNLNIRYRELETSIKSYNRQLDELKSECVDQEKELQTTIENLDILKEEIKVDDFILKSEEINRIEKEREKVEVNLKKYRDRLEELNKIKEVSFNELNNTNQELVKLQSSLDEKLKFRDETISKIESKVECIDNIEELLTSIQKEIQEIQQNFIELDKLKVEVDKNSQECSNNIYALKTKIEDLYKTKELDKNKLDLLLRDEGFKDIKEVSNSLQDKKDIEKLKQSIENYNNELSAIKGAIKSLVDKIGNRALTEEKWSEIQESKKDKEFELENLNKIKIKFEEELKHIDNKMIELKDLQEQKKVLDHKLAVLSDLEKLFKGKKFVEYVAATRLKYVSIEASNRLQEITNGNYGLEVDDDGRFIIRDYKNGGARRDASTLSGGETFLASLALALALSAEIQLKGTAPLELFFLDEGFGTLDDELLEVVMSSLERIHNERLKVGIISHVESIKNRVPVKLLITPAEAGMGGSKVNIERS